MFFRRKPKASRDEEAPKAELPKNKRRHYRREQTSAEAIQFKLKLEDDVEFLGEFIDASIGGAAARFTLANDPGLKVGDEVLVCITGKHHETGIETPARIVYVEPGGNQHWRYAFEFTSIGNLYAQLDEANAPIFNRRRNRRILIPPEQAIRAKLLWGSNVIDCKLYDLSTGGISVLLKSETAERLEGIERVRVQIDLHGNNQIIEGAADIRYRKTLPGRVMFGIQFCEEGQNSIGKHEVELDQFIRVRRLVIERWERAIRSA